MLNFMKKKLNEVYVCPSSHSSLQLKVLNETGEDEIEIGEFLSKENKSYAVKNGIPDFTIKNLLSDDEKRIQGEYDVLAGQGYEAAIDWLFKSYYENEDDVREKMVDILELKSDSRVLEVGCGTGRDSFRIAKRLSQKGTLFLQDLSPNMILGAKERFANFPQKSGLCAEVNFLISSATYLPFRDGYFDAVFHFGGFNNFNEKKKTLIEFSRVVKRGGKVVFGDESVPPWLEGTEFGNIVTTNNPLFKNKAPIEELPDNCRDVVLRWVLGCCFYLIDYRVGEGTPSLNLDLLHKGRRGGSLRTRYYGQLEGVSLEAKKMAQEAALKSGLSFYEWLDRLVKESAKKDLSNS
jgi:ubiquinone/menaquinone biosynthesis C-methylase UbiE/uncharacterized protein YbaR (Trm112 family)